MVPLTHSIQISRGIFAMLLVLAPVQGQDGEGRSYNSDALSYYLDGDMYMMAGEYREAAQAYAMALRFDSTSATIYLSLGEAYLQLDQSRKARRAGEQALHLEPEDGEVHKFLSTVAVAADNITRAIEHLDTWAKLSPTDLEPLFRRAGLQLQQKNYAGAVDTYIRIYDREPMQEQALTRAGEIALSIKDFDRGYEIYRRLAVRKPEDARILRTFAEVSARTNHVDEAITAFESLVEFGHASLGNRIQLAWLYRRSKRHAEALSSLTNLIDEGHRQWEVIHLGIIVASDALDYRALNRFSSLMIEVYPDSAEGYTATAIGLNNLDDPLGAIAILVTASERLSKNADVEYLLGNLYYSVNRYEDAEVRLQAALRLLPESAEARQLLAAAWSELKRFRASDSLYDVLITADVSDAIALNNYAYSLADREGVTKPQLKHARSLSRRSLRLEENNAAYLDTYGWILFRLGRLRSAQKYIKRSLAIRPDSPAVLEHMGAIHHRRGKAVQGDKLVEQARKIRLQRQELVRAED